jgi:hypothetical protein
MKVTYLAQYLPQFIPGDRLRSKDLPDEIRFRLVLGDGSVDTGYVSFFRDGQVLDDVALSQAYRSTGRTTGEIIASDIQDPWRNGEVEIV